MLFCCWRLANEVEVEAKEEDFFREPRKLGRLGLETRYGEEEEEDVRDAVMLRGIAFRMEL